MSIISKKTLVAFKIDQETLEKLNRYLASSPYANKSAVIRDCLAKGLDKLLIDIPINKPNDDNQFNMNQGNQFNTDNQVTNQDWLEDD